HYPRSAISLERLLADYFNLPVQIQQFSGQWLLLSEENKSRLRGPACPDGRNVQLGTNMIVGSRIWSVESKFRIRIGSVGYAQFLRLMPTGDILKLLTQLVRLYVGLEFDFDVQVVVAAADVPKCWIRANDPVGRRLGWNTWVRRQKLEHDP